MRSPSRDLKGGFPLCRKCFRRVPPDLRDIPGVPMHYSEWLPQPLVALSGRRAARLRRQRESYGRGWWYIVCDDCRANGSWWGGRYTNLRLTPHKRHPRRERRRPPLGRRR